MDEQMNYEQMRKMQSVIMESPTIKCENCGCELFEQRTIIKKISLLALGQGTGFTYHPLVVMVCSNCKELSPIDKETLNKGKLENI